MKYEPVDSEDELVFSQRARSARWRAAARDIQRLIDSENVCEAVTRMINEMLVWRDVEQHMSEQAIHSMQLREDP